MWRLLFRVYLYISILTLLIYGIDKLLAKMKWKRVPERWFHTLSLIGGFPGAFLGMNIFKHKTNKPKFRWMILASLLLHLSVIAAFIARARWF